MYAGLNQSCKTNIGLVYSVATQFMLCALHGDGHECTYVCRVLLWKKYFRVLQVHLQVLDA